MYRHIRQVTRVPGRPTPPASRLTGRFEFDCWACNRVHALAGTLHCNAKRHCTVKLHCNASPVTLGQSRLPPRRQVTPLGFAPGDDRTGRRRRPWWEGWNPGGTETPGPGEGTGVPARLRRRSRRPASPSAGRRPAAGERTDQNDAAASRRPRRSRRRQGRRHSSRPR